MANKHQVTDVPETCPACHGPTIFLGKLGSLDHYRCRDCGITNFQTKAADVIAGLVAAGFTHPLKEAGCGL